MTKASSFSFVGNTTKESTTDLQARLVRAGFPSNTIPTSSIITSLEACKKLATLNRTWRPLLLLSKSAQETFRQDSQLNKNAFYPQADIPPNKLNDQDRQKLQQCDTVIVALAPEFMGAEWMNEAFRILSNEYSKGEKRLVATHRGEPIYSL